MQKIVKQFIETNMQFAFVSTYILCCCFSPFFNIFRLVFFHSEHPISIYYNLISHANRKTTTNCAVRFSAQTNNCCNALYSQRSTHLNYSILKCRAYSSGEKNTKFIFFRYCKLANGHFKVFYWHGAASEKTFNLNGSTYFMQ